MILHLLAPVTLCIIHHAAIALHGAKCTVVTPECHGEALRFAIVVGQLGILIADVLDQVLILLCRIGKLLETLGSQDSTLLQLRVRVPLQVILFVGEEVFPLQEGMAHVSLFVLLPVRQEVKPVFDDFAHLDPLAPSVKHLGLQVVICAVPMLPATD